jgi:hypothetical protein
MLKINLLDPDHPRQLVLEVGNPPLDVHARISDPSGGVLASLNIPFPFFVAMCRVMLSLKEVDDTYDPNRYNQNQT